MLGGNRNIMMYLATILFLAGLALIKLSIICFKKTKKVFGWIFILIGIFALAISGTIIFAYFVHILGF